MKFKKLSIERTDDNRGHHHRLTTIIQTIKIRAKKEDIYLDPSWKDSTKTMRSDLWEAFIDATVADQSFMVKHYLIDESKGYVPGNVAFSKNYRKKRPSNSPFIAKNSDGTVVTDMSQKDFAVKFDISQPNISRALKLGLKIKDWTFSYADPEVEAKAKANREKNKEKLFEKMKAKNRERYQKNKGETK